MRGRGGMDLRIMRRRRFLLNINSSISTRISSSSSSNNSNSSSSSIMHRSLRIKSTGRPRLHRDSQVTLNPTPNKATHSNNDRRPLNPAINRDHPSRQVLTPWSNGTPVHPPLRRPQRVRRLTLTRPPRRTRLPSRSTRNITPTRTSPPTPPPRHSCPPRPRQRALQGFINRLPALPRRQAWAWGWDQEERSPRWSTRINCLRDLRGKDRGGAIPRIARRGKSCGKCESPVTIRAASHGLGHPHR